MLVLNPEIVRFDVLEWGDATLVSVERIGTRIVEDHDDLGPFAAFVDVPEQSIQIRVQRTIGADDLDDPVLGTAGELVFYAAPAADDRRRRRVTIQCVVVGVRPEAGTGGRGPTKTITFRARSADGTDPVVIDVPPPSEA